MDTPLAYSIVRQNRTLNIPSHELDVLLATLSWRKSPHFPRRGRMAWHVLNQPVYSNYPDKRCFRAVKLKGVGAYNPSEPGAEHRDKLFDQFSDKPIKPTTVPLESFVTYPHLGVRENGDFFTAFGSMAPVGGIVLDRAICEYEKAEHLCNHEVPSIGPCLVACYDDLMFQEQPMGVVLTLIPDAAPFRLSELQFGAALNSGVHPEKDAYVGRVMEALDIDGDIGEETTRLRAICKISGKMGASIRRFSEAGLYRYSADLNNFDFDSDTGDVVFTDLDSTRWMSELSPAGQHLQALRDVAMLPYRIIGKFYTPSALGYYTIDGLIKQNVIVAALEGYFPDAERADIERISEALWSFYMPHLDLLMRCRRGIEGGSWSAERRRSYKMDHQIFSIASFYLLYGLFKHSAMAKQYPATDIDEESILRASHAFLGERAGYLNYMLQRWQ